MFFGKNKSGLLDKLLGNFEYRNEAELFDNMKDNEDLMLHIFSNCSDLVMRSITIGGSTRLLLVYLRVLIDIRALEDGLMANLMNRADADYEPTMPVIDWLQQVLIPMAPVSVVDTVQDAVQRIVQGEVVAFPEFGKKAVSVFCHQQLHRELKEPNIESVILGPQVGFIENLEINMGLIRDRVRTPQLKIETIVAGKVTRNRISLAYLEGIADPSIVQEVRARLGRIQLDTVQDTGTVEELIRDTPHSPFPLMRLTQRPDSVAASLLEGKVTILIDGSPLVLVAPVVFWHGFQVAEDYYMHFIFATQLRWLRFLFGFIALAFPSFYVAVTTYHQEMIPTGLALTLAASREIIPFPTLVETFMMEITFDALREAGIRLPKPVGQTISIVGALVIGQAAVQAGIISAPIVMIVSLTGIASFLIPLPTMSQAISLLRFPMLIAAGMFGLYGIGMFLIVLIVHLANLRSFGVPYLAPLAPLNFSGLLDVLFRAPWQVISKRQNNIMHKMERE